MKRQACLFFSSVFAICATAWADIRPADGAKLNYTQVMFEYNEVIGADNYSVSIYPSDQPANKIIVKNKSLACIVPGLEFGKKYSWHYEAFKNDKPVFKSMEFGFSIEANYLVDTSLFRTQIDISKSTFSDHEIIFLDYRGIAIDRKGKPVWYYPINSPDGQIDPKSRNLRMTNEGTVIFLNDSICYEVDIDGRLLWKSPNEGRISGDRTEHYHHDMKKLDDGTYLTASWKYEYEPNLYNPAIRCRVRYNTLIQYDAAGNILWHWNEKDHVSREFIFGVYNPTDSIISGTHMNAFDYDAGENTIVMSNRHNSSIVKIDKKTGKIIYTIGVYDHQKKRLNMPPLFLHQHGMEILKDHKLLIYDNNASDDPDRNVSYPRILVLKEPGDKLPAYIDWEYECRSDRFPKGIIGKGGYATQTPTGNILVCVGGVNYTFEVTPGKQIVWQASFQKLENGNWIDFENYRTNHSSSLYPFHFTLQNVVKTRSSISITINNEGTEADSYEVMLFADGKKKIYSGPFSLTGRNSKTINIPIKKKFLKRSISIRANRLSNKAAAESVTIDPANQ
jgi:hypothetical protein